MSGFRSGKTYTKDDYVKALETLWDEVSDLLETPRSDLDPDRRARLVQACVMCELLRSKAGS